MIIIEIIGWIGVITYLIGYFLVSTKRLPGDSKEFQLLNLIGAIGIIINSGYHRVFPSVVVNVIWGFIALIMLLKILMNSRKKS